MRELFVVLGALELALVSHEIGHYFTAKFFKYPARFKVDWHGVGVIWGSDDVMSSYQDRMVVSLAGPLFNFITAGILFLNGFAFEGTIVGLLGFMLLLPFPKTDGSRAWNSYKMLRAERRESY